MDSLRKSFELLAVVLVCLSTLAATVPINETRATCGSAIVRKEWRTLSSSEKGNYIRAVQCLQTLPSTSPRNLVPGARTRYDDFNAVHINQSYGLLQGTGGIHQVGHFLPWHRYFTAAYENALRTECGYTGGQPYWDWTLDVNGNKSVLDSPIFSATEGFGGNGPVEDPPASTNSSVYIPGGTGGGCVLNGPFTNYTASVGPGQSLVYNPRCLKRSINPVVASEYLTTANVVPALAASDFGGFSAVVQGMQAAAGVPAAILMTFHGAGHYACGGEATDFISSSTEPLFFLHHAFIDLLWWKWQSMDLATRLTDISGPIVPFTAGPNVTLEFEFGLVWEGASLAIETVMDIRKGLGELPCYEYE
ncbi:hypothetical protein RUND412_002434 [Rhizina undulata]